MASTYSKLKIELIGTGDQSGTWGVTTNNNLGSSSTYRGLEQAIVGMATLVTGDFTTNSYTLPYTDSNDDQDFRCLVLDITATLSGAGTVIVPAIQKPYIVMNNSSGGYAVTVKVSGQTGVSVPNGAKVLLYNNGTDVGTAITYLTSLTLGTDLAVADGGTGISSGTSGGVPYFSSTSTMASSAALAANALVIGGGAGAAPATTTTGTGVVTAIGNNTNSASGLAVLGAGGTLAVAQGGTNATATPTAGAVAYGTGTAYAFTSAGTAGYVLQSNGSSAPTWVAAATGDVTASGNNAFTGANTFYNSTGQTFGTGTSTQDGFIVGGRAGGSNSYRITFTPGTLSASRTVTFPDGGGNYTLGYLNVPAVGTKTGSYTLATGDVGKYVQVGSGGSITIPDATFAEGDIISIFNNTSSTITITCSITTAYIAGTNSDAATMTLATRGIATVLFISSTVCVVSGNVT